MPAFAIQHVDGNERDVFRHQVCGHCRECTRFNSQVRRQTLYRPRWPELKSCTHAVRWIAPFILGLDGKAEWSADAHEGWHDGAPFDAGSRAYFDARALR